jgi:hypothetical protein
MVQGAVLIRCLFLLNYPVFLQGKTKTDFLKNPNTCKEEYPFPWKKLVCFHPFAKEIPPCGENKLMNLLATIPNTTK